MILIIPARGGSKGLPRKNIRNLNGKPLIAYAIENGRKARNVSEVIVSTDDPEIAEVARRHGASIPFMRPPELATDTSPAIETYLYTLRRLEAERGCKIESVAVSLPTSPLATPEDIDAAIELFHEKNADSVISYTEESHPILWHKFIDEDLRFHDIFDTNTMPNRQMLRKSYRPNGVIYVMRHALLERGTYYSENSYAYLMPRERSIDIDTLEDFEFAEFLLQKKGR
ncbi:MAG: acylneuraminate cytidylyltransferase family protein [Deltaproteobacteria bacterium]|nr:MAG: acylneuraminate cytidylyltransferase family protein [Deltaproteobacteria bacterium]